MLSEKAVYQESNPMRQKRGLWLGVVCLPLAAMAGCGGAAMPGAPPQGQDKAAAAPKVLVERPTVETITDYNDFTGHTDAMMTVEIRARVSGYLVEGLKDSGPNKEGTEVKKDELLFEIDPRSYEADKSKAEAALAQAQAHYDRLSQDLERGRNCCRRAPSPREITTRSPATTRRRRPR